MKCLYCNEETSNPQFCSKAHSASYHNSKKAKRRVEGLCLECKTPISTSRKYCLQHKGMRQNFNGLKHKNSPQNLTLRDVAQQYSVIRNNARRVLSKTPKICKNCSYEKHVQAAHIKPVVSFSGETLISEINNLNNLMWLCPNCHWEFDHGLLAVPSGYDPPLLD